MRQRVDWQYDSGWTDDATAGGLAMRQRVDLALYGDTARILTTAWPVRKSRAVRKSPAFV